MDEKFATPAYLIGSMKTGPGELRLEDGFIGFTSRDGGLVFRAPTQDVQVSFPKWMILPPLFPLPGIGIELVVDHNPYRLSFMGVRYTTGVDFDSGDVSLGPGQQNWSFTWPDVAAGRATTK
jgi:hypothetical protein